MKRNWLHVAALIAMTALTVSALAGGRNVTVSIKGGKFNPAAVTIKAGDTVTWVNGDDKDHTVQAADGSFNSGNIEKGGSYSFTFKKAGRYGYSCGLHPRMRGTVVVQ
jgi:plastocyanin